MTELQKHFHELYWLGKKPMTFNEIEKIMKIDRKLITELYNQTKQERDSTKNQRAKWLSKFPDADITFGEFLNLFDSTQEKVCHYCGISETQLKDAIENGIIWTKRSGRGPSLEMDRRRPNEPYSNTDNIVFACYWCNNAKTDTFDEDEAMAIGSTIKEIWNKRLMSAGIDTIK